MTPYAGTYARSWLDLQRIILSIKQPNPEACILHDSIFIILELSIGRKGNKFAVTGFPDGSVVKHLLVYAGDAGDVGSIPQSGSCPGGGKWHPPECSCLEATGGLVGCVVEEL